jgi:flavin reductase ActVB
MAAVDSVDFRNALARFASGVTVVTTIDAAGRQTGFTASAFSSLSLSPPLVLVCLEKRADCYPAFMSCTSFAVSVLAAGQTDLALRFAERDIDKFAGTPASPGEATGMPLIDGALAHLECRVYNRVDGGDHAIIVGEVLRAAGAGGDPLLHFNRRFGRFVPDS